MTSTQRYETLAYMEKNATSRSGFMQCALALMAKRVRPEYVGELSGVPYLHNPRMLRENPEQCAKELANYVYELCKRCGPDLKVLVVAHLSNKDQPDQLIGSCELEQSYGMDATTYHRPYICIWLQGPSEKWSNIMYTRKMVGEIAHLLRITFSSTLICGA